MSKDDKSPEYKHWSYSTKVQFVKMVYDLGWEYDRMSSSGQETYDKLTELLGVTDE